MYSVTNFKTKKALKEAVAKEPQPCFQPNDMFGDGTIKDGEHTCEGPHYPEPHRWYARVIVKDGMIVKVKS